MESPAGLEKREMLFVSAMLERTTKFGFDVSNAQDSFSFRSRQFVGATEMNRTGRLLLAPVFFSLLCFFLFVSRHRFIDGDEGFYLLASRLVLNHKTPYLDFLYTQAPLLPYVYGIWMKFMGLTWVSARTLSALLTASLGLIVYGHVCRLTGKSLAGLSAVVLFMASTLVFAWYPIAKTYSLAGLFLFSAYVIVSRLTPASLPWWMACGGLLFGLSVDTRSYLAGVAPVFVWWIIRQSEATKRISNTLWFLGGLAIGIAPSVLLFAVSPDRYLFDNLGYHALRSNAGLIGDLRAKIHVARVVLVGPDDSGLQFGMVSTISAALGVLWRRSRTAALFPFLIAFVVGFVSILPTPAHPQYFCLCMPFLIVSAVYAVNKYSGSLQSQAPKWVAAFACAGLFVSYLVLGAAGFRNYLITGDVIGIRNSADAPNWRLERVREVSEAIDQVAMPEESIASFWPGYIFESKAVPYPGFENNFGWVVSWGLTRQERTKYHIISEEDLEAGFAAHLPRIVVLGNDLLRNDPRGSEYAESFLRSNGYALARTIGDASIYVCCSHP
jgi:hypothetical protein